MKLLKTRSEDYPVIRSGFLERDFALWAPNAEGRLVWLCSREDRHLYGWYFETWHCRQEEKYVFHIVEWTVPLSPVFHFSLFHSTLGKVVDGGSRNTPFCLVNPLLRKQPCLHLRQPSVVEKRHIFLGLPTCWYRLHVGFRVIILKVFCGNRLHTALSL